ncbi:MAG: zinc-dependent alcohol dehydrogenase family protein [Steroidobacteraceae bacterium]
MRCQQLLHRQFGQPESVLELEDCALDPPRAGQAIVAIEAAPIHAGDLKNIAGGKTMYRHVRAGSELHVALPQVPGIEGIARIVAVGEGGARRVGERVFLPPQCGSWRSHMLVDESALIGAPEGDALQLSLMVNAFTAELALRDLAPLEAGDWFVQNAANSNVGRVLIRLAKDRGLRTVNIVRRAELVGELRQLGGDIVIEDGADLAARVRAQVGDARLSIALDSIGGSATDRLAEVLSDSGTVASMGSMSGEPCSIANWLLLYRRIRLIGYYAGFNLRSRSRPEQAQIITELAMQIARGDLFTPIAATYPLTEYRRAVRHAAGSGSGRNGKVVFVPA